MPGCRKRIALSAAALIVAFEMPVAVAGPSARTLLSRAHADWSDQEYERVVERTAAMLRTPGASRAQRIEALRLQGSAHAVLGAGAAAARSFEALLSLQPTFRMPRGTSPRILSIFEPTRARWLVARETALRERLGAALAAMKLDVVLPRRARGGLPLPVTVRLDDPRRLAKELLVFYRRAGTRSYSRLSSPTRSTRTTLDIPGVFTASREPYRLELYVEVLHGSGIALLRRGNEAHPMSLAMSAGSVPRPKPLYKKWWFWAGTAALVIAVPLLVDQAIDAGPQTVITRWR